MKRCPQCNSLYENAVEFCLRDGTPLVEESFTLPSDEDPTIVRHDPITINIPQSNEFARANQPDVPENVVIVPVEKTSSTAKYALFLLIGLLLGGGLVLATLLITRKDLQSSNADSNEKLIESNQPNNIAQTKNSPAGSNANASLKTPDAETASAKHAEPNEDANDGLFNGRVIVTNARIRRDPSSNAPIEDVLPDGDRLDIIDRANPNSPWYQVECEHGTSGWMHGDTIEFTKGNF